MAKDLYMCSTVGVFKHGDELVPATEFTEKMAMEGVDITVGTTFTVLTPKNHGCYRLCPEPTMCTHMAKF